MNSGIDFLAVLSTDLMAIGLLIVTRFCAKIISMDSERKDIHFFKYIFYVNVAACLMDIAAFYVDGMTDPNFMNFNRFYNFVLCAADVGVGVLWVAFYRAHLYGWNKKSKDVVKVVGFGAAFFVLFDFVGLFTGWVFTVSKDNVYSRSWGIYLFVAYVLLCLFYTIVDYIRYRRMVGIVRFFPIAAFLTPVIVGIIIQTLIYGTSFIWPSLSVSICAATLSLQNELAYLDEMTGLLNRAYLYSQKVYENSHGLLLIDVNGFHSVNDRFGHAEADDVLKTMGKILSLTAAQYGTAIRNSGDEFFLFTEMGNRDQLGAIAEEIQQRVTLVNNKDNKLYKLSVSIGYINYDPGKDRIDDVLKLADTYMNENKDNFYARHPELARKRPIS